MARGRPGAFGGKLLTSWPVWLGLSARLPARPRRPAPSAHARERSICSCCSRSASRSRSSTAARCSRAQRSRCRRSSTSSCARRGSASARRSRPRAALPRWPVWVLAAATLFLVGFRVGLNVDQRPDGDRRRIRGRDRRRPDPRRPGAVRGDAGRPTTARRAARPAPTGRSGNGSSRTAAASRQTRSGDTYGPVAYLAYVPAVLVFGWSGRWDDLPAAHATAIAFDLLVLAGLVLVGRRFGGVAARRGARVRLGRLPVHRLRADVEHERRDHARAPRVGLLARLVAGRARRRHRARGAGRSSPR